MDDFTSWIGRSEQDEDRLSHGALARLSALLDHVRPPWRGGEAPPLAHWLCFLPAVPQSEIDADGHPKRGGFLPPVPLPRRMWAGGRLDFPAVLPIDAPLVRRSTIADVRSRAGASGSLVFVTVRHEISAAGTVAIVEEQDLVYREASGLRAADTASATPVVSDARVADVVRTVAPDPTMLFRFSALTFNGHRIHYDRDYARDVEGYPGLVVHGPFLATLLLDHYLRHAPAKLVSRFAFRAQKPLFDAAPFDLCATWVTGGATLWVRDAQGQVTMTAEIEAA